MLEQVEGSWACATAVARCRPQVVAAYPISPQTHIVEALSDLVRLEQLAPCEYLTVESEFGAMSACIGAAAMGSRAYTATSSQGLLFMAEALFNASGLGLPIVMTVANRAIGAPINIWNDHSDAMAMRDSGWIQLYAGSNQEAVDLHLQAFGIAERIALPVMVCMDGFVLTHAVERIDVPTQEEVDAFVPALEPRQVLDPDHPVSIGAMVGPEAFTEVKYLMHARQMQALDEITRTAADFAAAFGRPSGGLLRTYRTEGAETVVVALGSQVGTIEVVVDELRAEGYAVGLVELVCFRPWPEDELRRVLSTAARVVVVERAFAPGAGGVVAADVRVSLAGAVTATGAGTQVYGVVAGLGGRPVTRAAIRDLLTDVWVGRIAPGSTHFLGLRTDLVEQQLRRESGPRPGPHAESVLREVGIVGSSSH